jgi:hypothetical protein
MTRIFLGVIVLFGLLCWTESQGNFSGIPTSALPVTKTTVQVPTAGPTTPFNASLPFSTYGKSLSP